MYKTFKYKIATNTEKLVLYSLSPSKNPCMFFKIKHNFLNFKKEKQQ